MTKTSSDGEFGSDMSIGPAKRNIASIRRSCILFFAVLSMDPSICWAHPLFALKHLIQCHRAPISGFKPNRFIISKICNTVTYSSQARPSVITFSISLTLMEELAKVSEHCSNPHTNFLHIGRFLQDCGIDLDTMVDRCGVEVLQNASHAFNAVNLYRITEIDLRLRSWIHLTACWWATYILTYSEPEPPLCPWRFISFYWYHGTGVQGYWMTIMRTTTHFHIGLSLKRNMCLSIFQDYGIGDTESCSFASIAY